MTHESAVLCFTAFKSLMIYSQTLAMSSVSNCITWIWQTIFCILKLLHSVIFFEVKWQLEIHFSVKIQLHLTLSVQELKWGNEQTPFKQTGFLSSGKKQLNCILLLCFSAERIILYWLFGTSWVLETLNKKLVLLGSRNYGK